MGRKRKLDVEQVLAALWMYYNTSCSIARVARHYGVSQATMTKVLDGTYRPRPKDPK